MGKAAVLDMTGKTLPESKAKTSKQPLHWLEERPQPEWFVKMKTPRGQVQWFLRFTMIGMRARLYGPFDSKRRCIEFLDRVLGMDDLRDLTSEVTYIQDEMKVKEGAFTNRWCHYPLAESDLLIHLTKSGRERTTKKGRTA